MDAARHIVAIILLLSLPPAFTLWFIIHPFVSFWRRHGPVKTYAIVSVAVGGMITGLYRIRDWALATDLGTNPVMIALAALCVLGGGAMSKQRKKRLSFRMMVGIPELSQKQHPGTLLTDGIYARLRHPRYVEVLLWSSGYACFANYLGTYILIGLSVPMMALVVILEERELHSRFGEAYSAYCRNVPRFFPKRRR
jgi:protein-S-isoprenylcysteine O-methyltransferase Ste14